MSGEVPEASLTAKVIQGHSEPMGLSLAIGAKFSDELRVAGAYPFGELRMRAILDVPTAPLATSQDNRVLPLELVVGLAF